jgi:hypothetical protein
MSFGRYANPAVKIKNISEPSNHLWDGVKQNLSKGGRGRTNIALTYSLYGTASVLVHLCPSRPLLFCFIPPPSPHNITSTE